MQWTGKLIRRKPSKSINLRRIPDLRGEVIGTLQIFIKPELVASTDVIEQRGQWRFLGEGNPNDPNDLINSPTWRNSGASEIRPAGSYVIEFKPVPGRTRLPNRGIIVTADDTVQFTVIYADQASIAGTLPQVLDVATVTVAEPYSFSGQVQTDIGDGSGYAVRKRVVLTAGHVVFDDLALTFSSGQIRDDQIEDYAAEGVRWRFQRMRGQSEPVAITARGSYVLRGYAASRQGATPGQGTPQSQENDVAAIYFHIDAARGGAGGYLLSDAVNEWPLKARRKIFISYPTNPDHILVRENLGRMHATPPANIAFTKPYGAASDVYRTIAIAGVAGSNGGALCVEWDDGRYYPAAVYVGGNAEAVLRGIDAEVDDMIQRAVVSSEGGNNNNNGGIVRLGSRSSGGFFTIAKLTVNFTPGGVMATGAKWRVGTGPLRASGESESLTPGNYTITFTNAAGFVAPPNQQILIKDDSAQVISGIYCPLSAITATSLPDAVVGVPYSAQITATNLPTSFCAPGLAALGLSIAAGGQVTGTPLSLSVGVHDVAVTVTNACGTSAEKILSLVIREPGTLIVDFDSACGKVNGKPAVRKGRNIIGQDSKVVLTAVPKFPNCLFDRWILTEAAPLTPLTDLTLKFRMTESAFAKAIFVPNPFLNRRGDYVGLLGVAGIPSGQVTVSVTKKGAFTALVKLGRREHTLIGRFDLHGDFTGEITRRGQSALAVHLHLDLAGADPAVVTGSIVADGVTHDLTATVAAFDEPNPAPKGRYTLALAPDPTQSNPAAFPQGYGYALITVNREGAVRAAGKLGDGQSFTAGGRFTSNQTWPLYVQPYGDGKKGLLGGVITFTDATAPAIDELHGTMHWQKPAANNGRYPAGFDGEVAAFGSRYVAQPPGTPALDISDWTLAIGTEVLPAPVLGTASLDNQNRFTLGGAAAGLTTLKLDPETGLLRGTVRLGSDPVFSFRGVLLQSQRQGRGVLLLPDHTAPLSLDPE